MLTTWTWCYGVEILPDGNMDLVLWVEILPVDNMDLVL